jgi:hypothetical protein
MDVITSELVAEQHVMDDLLVHLAHASVAGLEQDVRPTWRELERRILSLLAVEELLLLPLLGAEQSETAASTRQGHRRLRELTCALSVAVDLRNVRVASIEQLRTALREHAQREAGALYRHAWERTTVTAQHRLAKALRGAARSARHSEPPPAVRSEPPPAAHSEPPRAGTAESTVDVARSAARATLSRS